MTDKNNYYSEVIVKRDNLPSLLFQGKHLGSSVGDINNGRWVECGLWLSKSGAVICQSERFSQWVGERTVREAKVCESQCEVEDFLKQHEICGSNPNDILGLIAGEINYTDKKESNAPADGKLIDGAKTFALDEFKTLVNDSGWDHEFDSETNIFAVNYHNIPSFSHECDDYVEHNPHKNAALDTYSGNLSLNSSIYDFSIYYQREFSYIEHLPETFKLYDENNDSWSFEGFIVVDDDGEPIKINELIEFLPSAFSDIGINIEDFMDCEHCLTCLDMSKLSDAITLKASHSQDIAFSGALIAQSKSTCEKSSGAMWSGEIGVSFVLELYETSKGRFVCYRKKATLWHEDKDISEWSIVNNKDDIRAFFGQGWLAHDLYKMAGIDNVVHID